MDFVTVVVLNTQNQAKIQSIRASILCETRLAIFFKQVNQLIKNNVAKGLDVLDDEDETCVL